MFLGSSDSENTRADEAATFSQGVVGERVLLQLGIITSFSKVIGKGRKRAYRDRYTHSFAIKKIRAKNIKYSRRYLGLKSGRNVQGLYTERPKGWFREISMDLGGENVDILS